MSHDPKSPSGPGRSPDVQTAPRSGRWLWRFVGLFDVRFRRGLAGIQLPLWKSWDDEDFERWETLWFTAGRAHTARSEITGEPRFYIWRYDGRKRFRLWLTNRISISAGRDYEDFERLQEFTPSP